MACGNCNGCGGMKTTTTLPPAYGAAPSFSVATVAPSPAPMITPCGKLPWWWLLIAFALGASMKRKNG